LKNSSTNGVRFILALSLAGSMAARAQDGHGHDAGHDPELIGAAPDNPGDCGRLKRLPGGSCNSPVLQQTLIAILQIVEQLVKLRIGSCGFGDVERPLNCSTRIVNACHHIKCLDALNEMNRTISKKNVKPLSGEVRKAIWPIKTVNIIL